MIKVILTLVGIAHVGGFGVLAAAFLGQMMSGGLPEFWGPLYWAVVVAFVAFWAAYLIAILSNRAGQDSLLGFAIEAHKAELRRSIRERDASK